MSPLVCLGTYLGAVFVGAALLAPLLYSLTQLLAESLPWMQDLARHPFHRYVNRCLLALALVGVYPFFRSLGIRSYRDLGLVRPISWRRIWQGFGLGFALLAIVVVAGFILGARRFAHTRTLTELLQTLPEIAATAITVSVLEETLFRGALFGALRKQHNWAVAWVLSSAIYALLHFFGKPAAPVEIHWFSGFTTLASMLAGIAQWDLLMPSFLTLGLLGMVLALAYERTGNLYFSFGLHAGCVFCLQVQRLLVENKPSAALELAGSRKLIDGWVAFLALSGVLWLLWHHAWARSTPSAPASKQEGDIECERS